MKTQGDNTSAAKWQGVSPELCRVWFNFSTGKYDVHDVDGQVAASFALHSDAVAYTITMRS